MEWVCILLLYTYLYISNYIIWYTCSTLHCVFMSMTMFWKSQVLCHWNVMYRYDLIRFDFSGLLDSDTVQSLFKTSIVEFHILGDANLNCRTIQQIPDPGAGTEREGACRSVWHEVVWHLESSLPIRSLQLPLAGVRCIFLKHLDMTDRANVESWSTWALCESQSRLPSIALVINRL